MTAKSIIQAVIGVVGGSTLVGGIVWFIQWTATIDKRLGVLDSLEKRVVMNETSIAGQDGLRIGVSKLTMGFEQFSASIGNIQCRLVVSHTGIWYRDFELQLWDRPIDELTKPDSREQKYLAAHIDEFRTTLELCAKGKSELDRLDNLREGFKQYDSGRYLEAYNAFQKIDRGDSLTQRFLAAALGHRADETKDKSDQRRAEAHSRKAFTMAAREVSTKSKEIAVKLLHCNAYSAADRQEAKEGAKCFMKLADDGIKPSFSFAAAASFYAEIDDYDNAIDALRKYKAFPTKEIGTEALRKYQSLNKLLDSQHAKEYRKILEQP